MTYRFTETAAALPDTVPFVGPETQERARGAAFRARLGANESVFGPSPKAVAAMAQAAGDIWMYGDPESHDLKAALSRHHGVRPDNIVIGEGIDGLLGYLVRLFVGPGDAVVTSQGAYPTFNYHVSGFGGVLHKVPYRRDHEDPEALFAKARAVGAKLVYLSNPDNPMGTWHTGADLAAALEDLPAQTLLVLDEAYVECAPEGTALPIDKDDPRVIRMRTFSKGYGMAGARIGYALAEENLARAFNKVRNHFGVSRIAQAGALAALADQEWLAGVRRQIVNSRDAISALARAQGLTPLPSAANFVTIDCGQDGAHARAVLEAVLAQGVFARMPFVAPQDRCIRISCATREAMDILNQVLPSALKITAS